MLPSKHRLTRRTDFSTLMAKGKKSYSSGFGLRFITRHRPTLASRIGFVVGTKVSKDAVVRNLLKRRMRAVVHQKLAQLKGGFDIIIMAFPEAKGATYEKVEQQINAMLNKSGLV